MVFFKAKSLYFETPSFENVQFQPNITSIFLSFPNREAEEAEQQRLLEEEFIKEKEAKKEGMRKRKPAFKATEKTDEDLKGYSKLNMELTKGAGVKAVVSKV